MEHNSQGTPSDQGIGLLHLPIELLDNICGWISATDLQEDDPSIGEYISKNNFTIASLSRCSHALYAVGLRHLYGTVMVYTNTFTTFMRTLDRRPDLGASVRRLFISAAWSEEDYLTIRRARETNTMDSERKNWPEMFCTDEWIPSLLFRTKKLRVLNILSTDPLLIANDMPLLSNLEKLHLEFGGMIELDAEDGLSRLLEHSPNLKTLVIKGPMAIMDDQTYPNITDLTITAVSAYEEFSFFDVVAACTKLENLTYDVSEHCESSEPFGTMMNTILSPHWETLRCLRLEPTLFFHIAVDECLDSLAKMVNLEHLSISTLFFARYENKYKGQTVAKLLTDLPASLQTLNIRKEYREIDSELVDFIKAHQHSNLEELVLRIPDYVTTQVDNLVVPGLEEACQEAGIVLSVMEVPSFPREANNLWPWYGMSEDEENIDSSDEELLNAVDDDDWETEEEDI